MPVKEKGATIRAAAANAGQSLQGYILQAVEERMARETQEIPASEETNS
jgi:uncharacterized protein (DUF1778 family)